MGGLLTSGKVSLKERVSFCHHLILFDFSWMELASALSHSPHHYVLSPEQQSSLAGGQNLLNCVLKETLFFPTDYLGYIFEAMEVYMVTEAA